MPSGCEKVKLGLLRKQLSLGSLTRKISRSSQGSAADAEEGCIRQHLLEEAEPVSTTVTDSKTRNMTKEKSKSDEKMESSTANEVEPKHKIPSSLVKLTELEKRQLEDVLMRIGLKDCGL